jgi:hypothetical protein
MAATQKRKEVCEYVLIAFHQKLGVVGIRICAPHANRVESRAREESPILDAGKHAGQQSVSSGCRGRTRGSGDADVEEAAGREHVTERAEHLVEGPIPSAGGRTGHLENRQVDTAGRERKLCVRATDNRRAGIAEGGCSGVGAARAVVPGLDDMNAGECRREACQGGGGGVIEQTEVDYTSGRPQRRQQVPAWDAQGFAHGHVDAREGHMYRRRLRIGIVAIGINVLGLLSAPPESTAQKTTLPPELVRASMEPSKISRQLRMASELGRTVLNGLQALPADDTVPLDPGVLQGAKNTYVLIRTAKEGVELRMDRQKFKDPMTEVPFRRLVEAWNLSRTPVDKASWGMTRAEYLSISIRDLSRALQLVDQVLVMLP